MVPVNRASRFLSGKNSMELSDALRGSVIQLTVSQTSVSGNSLSVSDKLRMHGATKTVGDACDNDLLV